MLFLVKKMKLLIDKIAYYRKQKGYTYENIANELNITPAAYRKVEIGQTTLSVERLINISEILKIPLITFFDLENEESSATYNKQENLMEQNMSALYKENMLVSKDLIKAKDEQIKLLTEQLQQFNIMKN
jgi:transcriptional regulator with XRE-family HTH domain